ncbi:MAG: hypothetical protein ISS77_07180 [Phycisphaerae bacterium]|nr:hypothetical protein [Phycisphaerae bacterium]
MIQLRQQVKDASPTFYLTLISIISSLAFGYLLSGLKLDLLFGNAWKLLYWLQITATLQAIIIMWHEFAMSTVTFKWVINYIDSLIPFLFGIALFAIVTSINPTEPQIRFYSFAGFSLVGSIAYKNQFLKSRKEHDNKQVIKILGNYHSFAIQFSLVCTILFLVFGIISPIVDSKINSIFLSISNILCIGYVILVHRCWSKAFSSSTDV